MTGRRDPLSEIRLLPPPERPSGRSRRSLQKWNVKTRVAGVVNRAVLGLRQLSSGNLDDSLLSWEVPWGDPNAKVRHSLMDEAIENLYLALQKRPPPADRPLADAALRRLRGERGISGLPSPGTSASTDASAMKRLRQQDPTKRVLPKQGDMSPSHWGHVALPAAGSRPVDVCAISPRCRRYLTDLDSMLHPDWEERRANSATQPYMDPHS